MPRLRGWAFATSILGKRPPALTKQRERQSNQLLISRNLGHSDQAGTAITPLFPLSSSSNSKKHGQNGETANIYAKEETSFNQESQAPLDKLVAYTNYVNTDFSDEPGSKEDTSYSTKYDAWSSNLKDISASYNSNLSGKRWQQSLGTIGILSRIPGYRMVRRRRRWKLLRQAWFSLGHEDKRLFGQSALLHALNVSPNLAVEILRDLIVERIDVPSNIAIDIHSYAGSARVTGKAKGTWDEKRLTQVVLKMILQTMKLQTPEAPCTLKEQHLLLLSRRASRRQFKILANLVLSRLTNCLPTPSLCHLAQRAVSHGLPLIALAMLKRVPNHEKGQDVIQWVCVQLLRQNKHITRRRINKIRMYFSHEILTAHIPLGNALRNTMIQVFMENREPDLAWSIFRKSLDESVRPTRATFSALLEQRPAPGLSEILEIIQISKELNCFSANLGRCAMDAVGRLQISKEYPKRKAFQIALRVYMLFFDLGPLIDIGFLDHSSQTRLLVDDSPRATPQPVVLLTMIRAFCEQYAGSVQIWNSYQLFMANVLSKHRIISRVASNPWAFEYFMAGMRSEKRLLSECMQVLHDMLEPSSIGRYAFITRLNQSNLNVTHTKDGVPKADVVNDTSIGRAESEEPASATCISKPRGTTWNIMLQALINAHDFDSAEKLVSIMQEEGFKPTLMTHELLRGIHTQS